MSSKRFCLSLFLLLFSVCAAYADELFYVELGSARSQEEAAATWEDLMKTHRDELGGMQFYPVVIPVTQHSISLRILGGPIETKEEAQKTCNALFKKKAQCFVVEGMESPEKVAQRRAQEEARNRAKAKPAPLPWLAEEENNKTQDIVQVEKPGFWSSLFGSASDEGAQAESASVEIAEPLNLTPREAKVEVAEAIPVPISDVPTGARPDFVETAPIEISAPSPVVPPEGVKVEKIGWLTVQRFESEDAAGAFWQKVRNRNGSLAAGLRVRISRPLMARRESNVTLSIGPFGSEQDSISFCQQAIAPLDSTLACSFSANEPRQAPAVRAARSMRSHEYLERRQRVSALTSTSEKLPRIAVNAYWVHLSGGSADQAEALEAWETLKADNADLLRGYSSRVSASMGAAKRYNVRIGPIEMQEDAAKLCADLQERGVACKVFSNK